MELSPSDPFERDWPVDAAPVAAPEPDVPAAPSVATEAETPYPWSQQVSDPFTPLDRGLWQTPSSPEASQIAIEASNPTVAEPVADVEVAEPAADPEVAVSDEPTVASSLPEPTPAPGLIEIQNPFADSRWVDVDGGPALPDLSSNTQTSQAIRSPEADTVAADEVWNPNLGLIAPRGAAAYQTVNLDTEEAPAPNSTSNIDDSITPIRDIELYFQPAMDPTPVSVAPSQTERQFIPTQFTWQASNVYHNPLYFEDVALERYGHSHHPLVQPLVSAGKFGVQFVGLPYKMAIDPVWDEEYVLGWYRPGELAPYLFYQVPWNWKAAATAAGTYTGLIFLFP